METLTSPPIKRHFPYFCLKKTAIIYEDYCLLTYLLDVFQLYSMDKQIVYLMIILTAIHDDLKFSYVYTRTIVLYYFLTGVLSLISSCEYF